MRCGQFRTNMYVIVRDRNEHENAPATGEQHAIRTGKHVVTAGICTYHVFVCSRIFHQCIISTLNELHDE